LERAVVEVPRHGGEHGVVRRVQVVEDRPGKGPPRVQGVQKARKGPGLGVISHGVPSRIQSQCPGHPAVAVAKRPQVELLHPAQAVVVLAEEQQKGGLELFLDRKSTRLNSSHVKISYAVFCLKKKKRVNHKDKPCNASVSWSL